MEDKSCWCWHLDQCLQIPPGGALYRLSPTSVTLAHYLSYDMSLPPVLPTDRFIPTTLSRSPSGHWLITLPHIIDLIPWMHAVVFFHTLLCLTLSTSHWNGLNHHTLRLIANFCCIDMYIVWSKYGFDFDRSTTRYMSADNLWWLTDHWPPISELCGLAPSNRPVTAQTSDILAKQTYGQHINQCLNHLLCRYSWCAIQSTWLS